MSTVLDTVSRIALLRQVEQELQYVWDCGNPDCEGQPGCRTRQGFIVPVRHARRAQIPPEGDWRSVVFCTGRGWGKSRSAAEYVKNRMLGEPEHRVGIIAPDFGIAKNLCMEGESGLLACMPKNRVKSYNKTTGVLTLTNGSMTQLFGATTQMDAEKVRGFQFHTMWYEELATMRYGEVAWDIAQFSLRLGQDPRIVVTTTPRATPLMKRILKREPGVQVVRGRTIDNEQNLATATVEYLRARYEGTTLGRQELEGELLEMMPGALWDLDVLDRDRQAIPAKFDRVVVAVDPAGSHRDDSDETGIIVVGQVRDHYWVIADYSGTYTPDQWSRQAIMAYREHGADRVVAEGNYGGDMVEATLRAADRNVSYRRVTATRGKVLRAEPIVALYERHLVHHPDPGLPGLEEQMCTWIPPGQFEFDGATEMQVPIPPSPWSPDRIDALVWGLTELSQVKKRYSHG